MKAFLSCWVPVGAAFLLSCAGLVSRPEKEPVHARLVPLPARVERYGSDFFLDASTRLQVQAAELEGIGDVLVEILGHDLKLELKRIVNGSPAAGKAIVLSLDPSAPDSESYTLTVDEHGIRVTGKSPAAVFYGIQTLLQLLPDPSEDADRPATADAHRIPGVFIEDRPRFPWRGLHLDVCRHFFQKEFIKRTIDLVAMHKMNVFHWHLTDDQGWRIEIKKYPRLTEIGAWRVDREHQPWDRRDPPLPGEKVAVGGYYTQADVKEIVAYAAERFITVVPEIEMPAHAIAALAAYPELSCTGGPFYVMPGGIWPIQDIYCAGNERTFAFLEDVLGEVLDLFPSPFIHIGGDEANKGKWMKCPKCQARIRAEGLKDERELQSYFIRRIEKFLVSKNRKLIGWDEILEGGLAPRAAVMSWRGMEGGTEAARQGHEVVMTPTEYCYFDYYQAMDDEPPAIGGFLPLEKVYAFEPIPEDLDPDLHKFILGGQGNVWTEYISTPEHAEYMTFPRLCAMAEVLWSPKSLRNLDGFLSRMAAHYNRLDRMGVHYRIPRIGGFDAVNLFIDSVRVAVTNPRPGTDIRYTLDGTDPTPGSRLFREPLLIRENSVLTARLLAGSRYLGPAKRGEFLKRAPVKAVNPGSVKRGLAFDYHEGAFSSIQELEKSVATGSGRINGFDLPSGVPAENYGVVYTGFFKVPATGVYTWILNSDDGSRLFIGDTLLIDNDGLHGAIEKSAKIALESGFHPIRVAFFQAGGGSAFDVRWSGPGFSARPVPAAALWSDR